MLGVEPVTRKRLSRCTLALCDFVFMMRESEVDAASVNVQRLAEKFHGHCGTFDVPSGTSRTDFGFPEMFSRFRSFPECKVARAFFFVAIVVHARAGLDASQIDFGKLAVL